MSSYRQPTKSIDRGIASHFSLKPRKVFSYKVTERQWVFTNVDKRSHPLISTLPLIAHVATNFISVNVDINFHRV